MAALWLSGGHPRVLEQRVARGREQEARARQQWERHRRYLQESGVRSAKQAQWSSRGAFQARWGGGSPRGVGRSSPVPSAPRPGSGFRGGGLNMLLSGQSSWVKNDSREWL